jgi:hypothetical protein
LRGRPRRLATDPFEANRLFSRKPFVGMCPTGAVASVAATAAAIAPI